MRTSVITGGVESPEVEPVEAVVLPPDPDADSPEEADDVEAVVSVVLDVSDVSDVPDVFGRTSTRTETPFEHPMLLQALTA